MTPRVRRLLAPFDRLGGLLLLAFLAALLLPPVVPYEPAWELAAGLGYAACCAAILCFRLAPPPPDSYRLALHRTAGDAALALVAAHVAVMIAADPFVLDYLGWMMPLHVLPGALAAVAMLLAVATREPALRLPPGLRGGPRLHAWAGIVAGALAGAHALASSTKLTAGWRAALLASAFLVLLAPAVEGQIRKHRRRPLATSSPSSTWSRILARGRPQTSPPRAGAADIRYLLVILAALLALLVTVPAVSPSLRG